VRVDETRTAFSLTWGLRVHLLQFLLGKFLFVAFTVVTAMVTAGMVLRLRGRC